MKNLAVFLSLGALFASNPAVSPTSGEETAASYLLQSSRQPGQIDRVEVLLEVAGDRLEGAEHEGHRVPISGVAHLNYDEKTLELPAVPAGHSRSIRSYDRAEAVIKLGEEGIQSSLRPERCLIGVDLDAGKATLFSPSGTLTRDELALIDEVPGNTLLLDQVLPGKPVALGQKWKPSEQFLAVLLGLDKVRRSNVQCVLKEVTPALARMELSGQVSGTINGAASQIDLTAKCRFDRKANRIDWFAMRLSDKRELSPVDVGLDAAARLQVKISAKDESPSLSESALKDLPLRPTPELCQLSYQPADGSWQVTHDRAWYLLESRRDMAVMRMLAGGTEVAWCRLSALPATAPEKLPSLSQFQDDVRGALGKRFGGFVEAGQFAGDTNYRVYRVVANAEASQAPTQWHHYLVADERGRQVAVAFTIAAGNLERFDEAGQRLVRGIRFLDGKATGQESAPKTAKGGDVAGGERN